MEHQPERVKGPWGPEEDDMLRSLVQQRGARCWGQIARLIPGRTGKSCRLRWCNQLAPTVAHRPFTAEEDATIIKWHAKLGNKWARISRLLTGRSDNAVKNHWNSTLRRRLAAAAARSGRRRNSDTPSGSDLDSGSGSVSYLVSGSGSGSGSDSGSGPDLFSTGGPVYEPQLGGQVYDLPFSGPTFVPQLNGPVSEPAFDGPSYVPQFEGPFYVPKFHYGPVNEPELGVSTDLSLGKERKKPVQNNEPIPNPAQVPTMPPQQPEGNDKAVPPFMPDLREIVQEAVRSEVRKLYMEGAYMANII